VQDAKMRHKDMAKSFATVLKRHRAQKNITQEALAKGADIASRMPA
jgi:hypothetical protein